MVTGYEQGFYRHVEQISFALQGIHHELRRVADMMEADRREEAVEGPPDLSWMETEDIKADYGRDPHD